MTIKLTRPLLAAAVDFDLLRYPVLGSAKLDGVRCLAINGRPMSRSLKIIPNRYIQDMFERYSMALDGLDGELIVGDPTAPDAYRTTVSAVMSEDGAPDFRFYVFDFWDSHENYHYRLDILNGAVLSAPDWVLALNQETLENKDQLEALEERLLTDGYEGVILRCPFKVYKQGRSTAREGTLLKLKRLLDAEAVVVGTEELMHNGNAATLDERGYTKRSTHQANKVGLGTLGAFLVRGLPGTQFDGIEFAIGGGKNGSLAQADRDAFWAQRHALVGRTVKFSYFPVGVKEKPRHPAFLGFRDEVDL